VSLHRAEGFGYTMAESMWAAKPVIATSYSGNLDYMTERNSYLVDYRLVPIGPGHAPYPPYGVWAEPDVDHAARLMREVFDEREEALRRGRVAAVDIRASHSPEAAGRIMAERLMLLLGSPVWSSLSRGAHRPGPLHTGWVNDLIRSGPVTPGGRPRFGATQRAARKGLLRLLKPVTVHERMVDAELLKAVEKLDANLRSLALSHESALQRIDELQGELACAEAAEAAESAQSADRNGRS
jgi:glycosyltransferase involved in cell wall biosynthesis